MSDEDQPAAAAPKFPFVLGQCDHGRNRWNIASGVGTMSVSPSGNPAPDAPDREITGFVLVVQQIRCLDCGETFRFENLPEGDHEAAATQAVTQHKGRQLMTRIMPDRLVIAPNAEGSGARRKRIITAVH